MQDNEKKFKKPFRPRVNKQDMEIPGVYSGVRVVHGNIELALKMFKRKMKDSGKLEELKDRKEFLKPSAIKRRKMQLAIRADWQRRQNEH
jgi:small subunit ribosomal protein S21